MSPYPGTAVLPTPVNLVSINSLNATLIDPRCKDQCELVLSQQTQCDSTSDAISCLCTDNHAAAFASCVSCMVSLDPTDLNRSGGDIAITGFTNACAENNHAVQTPTLSISSASPTGTGTNGDGQANDHNQNGAGSRHHVLQAGGIWRSRLVGMYVLAAGSIYALGLAEQLV
ncbi:hypothetical protein D9758_014720 [Tetrapyrgos nigripes]|uniref:Uncharacterized protein n=1 Tax=Tetrapyrgos nigripes TaxID=182062 RepID=A0A8H5CAJ9_9AGAR|nr:hypothetical protein D9758_014720 [Tetrapyrgos nigripes]